MADILGAAVGARFNEVFLLLKKARRCKESLKKLESSLISIDSYAERLSGCGNDNHNEWLARFDIHLVNAKFILEEYCIMEGKRWWEVGISYSKKLNLSSTIMDLNEEICKEFQYSTSMPLNVALDVIEAAHGTTKSHLFGKVESCDSFHRLKTLVMSNSDAFNDPIILGLRGVGGIGKTFIAKMLYNDEDVKAKYGVSSILWMSIGCESGLAELYETMGKFLKYDIRGCRDLEQQYNCLVEAFQKKKNLLILDDVWEKKIHGKPMMYWLDVAKGKGSITVVTTRSNGVLTTVGVKQTISIPFLSNYESWKLFCDAAFECGSPPSIEVGRIAKDISNSCGGLPLALKVVGAAMYSKTEVSEWKNMLHMADRNEESKSVEEVLNRSYNKMGDDLKKCFLYFAAFPRNYKISTKMLCSIWDAEQLFGSYDEELDYSKEGMKHLVTLADWSMVRLSIDEQVVTVHDMVWNFANNIIREGDLRWAEDCLFLCGRDVETLPWLKYNKVKRMSLIGSIMGDKLESFDVHDLRVLLLSNLCKKGSQSESPIDYDDKIFLNNTKLRYIDFSNTNLHELPKGINLLKDLRYLDLSSCSLLKELPKGIMELNALISLDLLGCTSLKELPIGIGELKALTSLDLSGCSSLQELPMGIGKLKALTSLDLSGCSFLEELPPSIGELKALSLLDLLGCSFLKELPQSIGGLTALTSLDLSECSSLKELPQSFGELKALTSLDLSGCSSLKELPMGIGKLKALTSLDLSGCSFLEELPPSIGELKALSLLDLLGCSFLKELPQSIGGLTALTSLHLSECSSLEELPQSFGELKALTSLDLAGCSSLKELPMGIGKLKALSSLDLSGCSFLEELPPSIGELKALSLLDLLGCSFLKELPQSIGRLMALTSLHLSECSSLKELPQSIRGLTVLTSLDLSECSSLKELPQSFGELKALTSLDLSGCSSLQELPMGIGELTALTSLDLLEWRSLKELPQGVKELKTLTHRDLPECSYLEEIPEGKDEGEAFGTFESDESIGIDLHRLHCIGKPKNDNEIVELEALPSLNSSDEIWDKQGEGDELDADLSKIHDQNTTSKYGIYANIPVDSKKTTFEEMMDWLIASVQGVEVQVAKFLQHSGDGIRLFNNVQVFNHIQVFNRECGLLIYTLSRTVHDRLLCYNHMLRVVQETGVNNRSRIMINVTFCIVALTELESNFHAVVDLLTMCSNEKWWDTALELSNVLPSSSIPRWSRFSLTIRSCEWSMDIVDLAFHAMQQFLDGASTLHGVDFKWSDKQLRMVLHIDGKPLYHNEGERSLLDVTRELEAKDVTFLIDKLEALKIVQENPPKQFSNNIFSWKRSSKTDANLLLIANFLREKLRGPIPKPSLLPDTFELDPSTLTLKCIIGSGGYATVGKYEWLGKTMAVKTINEVNRKQLKAEAAILASVQHPSVVRIIGCAFEEKDEVKNEDEAEIEDEGENKDEGESEDIAKTGYLVMELMQDDLRKLINKRCPKPCRGKSPFPLTVAVDIMLQIGEGMRYLREHRILHRDLKAQNVLINKCSTSESVVYKKFPKMASLLGPKKYQRSCIYVAKLADFGISKARRNETSFKTPKLGTGSWRAPEVLNADPAHKYEWPADVYSFAMTCYEILTGRVPIDNTTELHQHIEHVDMPLLTDLVKRCWETDPKKRPDFDEICKTLWQCKVEIILPGFRLWVGP